MTQAFVCSNCGATHTTDSTGGCLLEILMAALRDRGTIDENTLVLGVSNMDFDQLWDEYFEPALDDIETLGKALAPKPPTRRRRGKGVPAAARAQAVAPQPGVTLKTFQVVQKNGERKLYQAQDKEQAEAQHKAAHPRTPIDRVVEIRR